MGHRHIGLLSEHFIGQPLPLLLEGGKGQRLAGRRRGGDQHGVLSFGRQRLRHSWPVSCAGRLWRLHTCVGGSDVQGMQAQGELVR